jgi:ATP-dependent exoDNAse (exonuclease V) beta subunit
MTPNLQILANAGSGKTHTLVSRIIALLARKQRPSSIIALTFTRKAAGEFLTKLITRLREAAADPEKAKKLSTDIGMEIDSTLCLAIIRELLADLGRMQLTTFDGFFSSVVSSFPQDLGLADSPRLLDPSAEKLMGTKALRSALAKLPSADRESLIHALMERDHSDAPTSACEELETFRKELSSTYLDFPDELLWGNHALIWNGGNPWRGMDKSALEACRQEVLSAPGLEKIGDTWTEIACLRRGMELHSVAKQIIANLDSWSAGTAELTYSKKAYPVSPAVQQAAAALVTQYIHETIDYRLKEASAVRHFLGHYHEAYQREVRGRGLLTFSDVTTLLQPTNDFRGMTQASPGAEGDSLARLQLDERLDARYDHWLLDEFQDTSRTQYLALKNLLDEVIMEGAGSQGQRSFFCVGDVKQAIYGWRKGDSRLFNEIHVNAAGGIERDLRTQSWRSSPIVLDALNDIFGNLDATAPGIPADVRDRWKNAWHRHEPARKHNPIVGHVTWSMADGPKAADRDEKIKDEVIELLKHHTLKITSGEITVALLVQSNKEATFWANLLRDHGIPALSESNPPVGRDNPIAAALRSVITLMAHPGDAFAKGHLSMEPLGRLIFGESGKSGRRTEIGDFLAKSAELKAEGGFTAVTEWFLGSIDSLLKDSFSIDRAASLRRAALRADESGITDADEFLVMLETYEEPGRSAPRSVQVMTIHKSKGLEYDMVIIPLLGKNESLDAMKNDSISAWRAADGSPFVIKLPPQDLQEIPGNETLRHAADQKRSELLFEQLCAWYVAMSRAKSALHLFTHEVKMPKNGIPDSTKCPPIQHLLAHGLRSPGARGDANWHEHLSAEDIETDPEPLPSRIDITPRKAFLRKETPSGHKEGTLTGRTAFAGRNAADLGTEVHELFERIDWLDTKKPWTVPGGYSEEALQLFRNCIKSPDFLALFSKPDGKCEIWKEKRFDTVLDGNWISGCFDRIVLHKDPLGNVTGAEIIDFKTDREKSREELMEAHGGQLRIYRRVLQKLLGLEEQSIRLILIQVRDDYPVIFL